MSRYRNIPEDCGNFHPKIPIPGVSEKMVVYGFPPISTPKMIIFSRENPMGFVGLVPPIPWAPHEVSHTMKLVRR